MTARCGSLHQAGLQDNTDEWVKIFHCREDEINYERQRVFFTTIQQAIDRTNHDKIVSDSLLSYTASHRVNGLQDILGQPIDEAVKLVSQFGEGYRTNETQFFPKENKFLLDSIAIIHNDEYIVSMVGVVFSNYNGDIFYNTHRDSYDRHTSPKNLSDKFGTEDHFNCNASHCIFRFSSSNYIVDAYFDKKLSNLLSILFYAN